MKGYSITEYFAAQHVEAFNIATQLVEQLPEEEAFGKEIRCHELTRAVYTMIHGTKHHIVDGTYGIVDHSWIDLGQIGYNGAILDCYSIARTPMVQLVDARSFPCKLAELYRPGPMRKDIDRGLVRDIVKFWVGRSADPGKTASFDSFTGRCK